MKSVAKDNRLSREEGCSPVEDEVRRKLAFWMTMLALSPVPILLVLLFFLYCLVQSNRDQIGSLRLQNMMQGERIRAVEQQMAAIQNKTMTNEGE